MRTIAAMDEQMMLFGACNAPYEDTTVLYPFKCDKVELTVFSYWTSLTLGLPKIVLPLGSIL